jgi:cation transport ATPase
MVQACVFVRLLSDVQVLVKNARTLETLGRLSVLGVDKTGTLTEGRFSVVEVALMPGAGGRQQDELFRLLCAVESRDPHPLASSIVRAHIGCAAEFASGNGTGALPRVDKFTRVESKGVWGLVNSVVIGAGSLDFLDDMCIDVPDEAIAIRKAWEESGGAFTIVYMSIDEDVAMVLRLEDSVRSDAKAAVQLLGTEGVRVSMLTGDSELPAQAVCAQVGITDFNAKMRPLGKEAWVRDQQTKDDNSGKPSQVAQTSQGALEAGLLEKKPAHRIGGAVGMLGDGLNDGPAMAAADVGIAISCGLQLTVDAADVVVNKGGELLLRLAGAVAMAKRGRRLVLQNLVLAMAIKVLVMMLAASGQLSLSMGIFTDTGSLLLVLVNGLRPLTWRFPFVRDSAAA